MSDTPSELRSFVQESLTRGLTRADTKAVLREAGWSSEHVGQAMAEFAEVDFPIPVPRPKPYLSAREAFLYLLLFTTLFLFAFNLGATLFLLIDKVFPDAVGRPFRPDDLRWPLSFVIVSFPIFLFLTIRQQRELRAFPEKRASKVRKWLTYLTLFIAAGFLIGDLIALVHSVLDGELTTRFLLKVLVVALLAGSAFLYYLRDLQRDER